MSYSIDAVSRSTRGKGPARQMRLKGLMPATLYGFGIEKSTSLSLDPKALAKALQSPKKFNTLFDLIVDGEPSAKVFVRELQRHPVSRALLHCDLVAPNLDKLTTAMVPVETRGRSKGVVLGGQLRKPYREIKLLAKPADFPTTIEVDITEMELGDTVMASELPLPEGIKALFDRDFVLLAVSAPRGALEDEETETETETEETETETEEE